MKILVCDAEETKYKGVIATLNVLNTTAYNELIIAQEDTVCFQIAEEAKTKANRYRYTRQVWVKLSGKFDPTTTSSKTILL